jgi:hypothetical protein
MAVDLVLVCQSTLMSAVMSLAQLMEAGQFGLTGLHALQVVDKDSRHVLGSVTIHCLNMEVDLVKDLTRSLRNV